MSYFRECVVSGFVAGVLGMASFADVISEEAKSVVSGQDCCAGVREPGIMVSKGRNVFASSRSSTGRCFFFSLAIGSGSFPLMNEIVSESSVGWQDDGMVSTLPKLIDDVRHLNLDEVERGREPTISGHAITRVLEESGSVESDFWAR